ncbi:MAG: phosphosulfolactate synthase [Rickettsia endosymbiont of Pseudomimeciton antennatum]|nr:phosphosulfolactate synthase [Rickettsia endosymbiont of Pseudomimeciton antennatum]MCC8398919.1 phosphosulfolactate synthase [Rickettsia endosymbiont of Labidopullus appendiculatus]
MSKWKMEKAYDFLKPLYISSKPRKFGITVVSEKAKSFMEAQYFIETVGEIVDYVKFPDHAGLMWRYSPQEIRLK